MASEVTFRFYDPEGRPAPWWHALLESAVESEGAEILEVEDEEV